MHKLICVFALAICIGTGAYGARQYGMAGCGLGSLVFEPDSGQIFAYTTNGTAYSQLFGITSGTSNCLPDEESKSAMLQEHFITQNFAILAKDMARGEGETLTAFTETLGCNQEVVPMVGSRLRSSYDQIMENPGAIAVLDSVKNELRQEPVIKASCQNL